MPRPTSKSPLSAIDVSISGQVQSKGVVYGVLTGELLKLFQEVADNEVIVGFEWDGTDKFGIIVQ